MAKALKTVGTIVGGMVLIATGVGAAMGVNVLGMGIMSYTGPLTVGQLGMISAGTVAAGMMLEKPVSTGAGSATDWTSNPDQPTPFAIGRVGASGKIIHRDEYGKDNRLQGIVSVYSGAGPIKGFVSYSTDGVGVTFASNGGTAIGKYNRQMWRSWRLGAQPDTALSLPTGLDGGAVMPGWGAAYRLSGKACELLTLQQDSKFSVYPSGEPKPLAVLEGIHGYDPRYDDTYPGGSGPCRYNERSTYRYIDNAIIGALNWALGLKENGQVVGGIGASLSGVDLPAFVEAANIADANNWKVTAWPDSSEDVAQVLKQLLQAGGANYARHAGKISCISRAGPHASILTMTARDTAGPIELDTGASRFDRINTITPEFMSEAHGWKHVPASPVSFADFVTEDGGKRSDRIKYRFVPSGSHAAQLAALDILDPREPFSGSVPLKPHMRQLKPGDCFTISEPGFLLDGVKCKVLSRSYNTNTGAVQVAFRSETAGKVALALGKTTTVPAYPELTPVDPTLVSPPLPGDWTIVPRPPASGGSQVPGFDLTGIVGNSTATAIIVEYGPTVAGPWTQAYQGPPTVTSIPINGVQPGATYFIAVQYQRNQNFSEREVFGPYVAPELIAGGVTDGLRADLTREAADRVVEEVGEDIRAGVQAGRDLLDQKRALGLAQMDAARATLAGLADAELNRERDWADILKRLGVFADLDPVAGTGIIKKETVLEADGPHGPETLAAMRTRLTAADAQVLLDATALSSAELAAARLLLATKAEVDDKISAARLLISTEIDGDISAATASLITASAVDNKIADARLLISSEIDGDILAATTGLTTGAQVDDKIAAARLLISSEIDGDVAAATATLASQSQLLAAIAASELVLKSYADASSAAATTGLTTGAQVDDKIAAARLLISSEIDLDLAAATAELISAVELAAALAGSEVSLLGQVDAKISTATATLASKAEIATNPNLLSNGSGELGLEGWTGLAGLEPVYWQPYGGPILKLPIPGPVTGYINSPRFGVTAGSTITVSWRGGREGGFGGTAEVYLAWWDAAGAYISETTPRKSISVADGQKFITATAPANAAFASLTLYVDGTGGPGQAIWINRVKAEAGSIVTAYTQDGTARALGSTAAIQTQAITDIETMLEEASVRLVAAPSGGDPAILELYANGAGSNGIRFRVRQIEMGENTVLDTITGLQTGVFGAVRRVVATGAAFGAGTDAGQLTEWEGPNSVPMSGMTRANAYYYRANTEPRHGGSAVASAGGVSGAAFTRSDILGQFTGTGWTDVASVSLMNKPSNGWFEAVVAGLSGYSDGATSTTVQFRIIESGASSPLATSGSISVPAGPVHHAIEGVMLSPFGPWSQTQPAGNLTLKLQARQTLASTIETHFTGGDLQVRYSPGA